MTTRSSRDVGAIFDLLAIRKGTGNQGGGKDFLAGYDVHTIALQIPISQLDTKSHVIGVWATTDRQKVTVQRASARRGWIAGLPPRQPARQRGRDPDGAQGPLEPHRTPSRDTYVPEVLQDADPRRGDEHSSTSSASRRRTATTSSRCCSRAIPKLNFTGPTLADELRVNLVGSRHAAERASAGSACSAATAGLAERAAARRRRRRHRGAGGGRRPHRQEGAARRRRRRPGPPAAGRSSRTRRTPPPATRTRRASSPRPPPSRESPVLPGRALHRTGGGTHANNAKRTGSREVRRQ